MREKGKTSKDLLAEVTILRLRLEEAEEVLRAIRNGEVDALAFPGGAQGGRFVAREGAERAYRTLVETMNEGALTVATDGTILYSNRRFAGLVDAPLEHVIGGSLYAFVASADEPKLRVLLERGHAGNKRERIRFHTREGVSVPTYCSAYFPEVEDRQEAGLVVTDLTDLVAAQEARLRLASIVESAEDAIIGVTRELIIESWNPAAELLYGYSAAEAIGQPLSLIVPPERVGNLADIAASLIAHFETVWVRKNGQYLDMSLTISPVRDTEGQVMGGSVIARDITARKQAEAQLRLAAKVFESGSQGIMITDARQRILSVNQAFSAITGYAPAEVIGKIPGLILKSGRHPPAFYAGMWEAIRETGHWEGEIWDRRKNGEIYPESLVITAVKDERGEVSHYIGVFFDTTQRKVAEERIQFLAHYDPLTHLPNRAHLHERLAAAVETASNGGHRLAALFIDLDRFKEINDSLGHAIGDLLLQALAKRLRACVREGDMVARLGGDEFVVVLAPIKERENAALIAEKILGATSRAVSIEGHDLIVTASIGISIYPDDGEDSGTLIKNADAAMYRAKEMGQNAFQYYDKQMNEKALDALSLEIGLRRALEHHEFLLYYQPRVELKSGRIAGMEALIRWRHPDTGLVPPAQFIPLAEERGLIVPIGDWVLTEACRQNREWQALGLAHIPVAVNISAQHFRQPNFRDKVAQALAKTGLAPEYLELEVTENSLMRVTETVITTLHALKQLGLQLSIDDFGTGYSSLSYLKRFPVDTLKIDQSFVRGLPANIDDVAIAKAILGMAAALRLKVVAEGVETRAQLDFLRAERCDEVQGYYYSKPLPPEELAALLRNEGGFLRAPALAGR